MINWNLIKCAFGYHKYSEPIKNETLNNIERICNNCKKVTTVVKTNELKNYNTCKKDIINSVESDSLCDAKQQIDMLLKDLDY